MPILLKFIKKELSKDADKKGVGPDGDYKHKPPRIVSRKLTDYTKLKILKLDRALRVGLKAIDFSGVVPSENTPGKKYRVTVRFTKVVYSNSQTEAIKNAAKMDDNKVVYYKTPTIGSNPVMLKCSCDDFRHRFEHQLADVDALIGAPRKYKRKTPLWPIGYPYANSTDKVGMCKHVYSMVIYLKAKKLITER